MLEKDFVWGIIKQLKQLNCHCWITLSFYLYFIISSLCIKMTRQFVRNIFLLLGLLSVNPHQSTPQQLLQVNNSPSSLLPPSLSYISSSGDDSNENTGNDLTPQESSGGGEDIIILIGKKSIMYIIYISAYTSNLTYMHAHVHLHVLLV